MRIALCALPAALVALVLTACGAEPPSAPTPEPQITPLEPLAPAPPPATTLDTATVRQRAADALSANRLYTPRGDNAVEHYLALRLREPADAAVDTALADLAPYVIIGAEQAIAAETFPEAGRLIELLARMDAEAPAVPRLREALATAESDAATRAAAAQAEADGLAADAPRRGTATPPALPAPASAASASTSPPPSATAAAAPAPGPTPSRPVVLTTAPATPATAPTPRPATSAERPARPTARALVHRVSPRFPEAANRRRLEGQVELSVRIAADGSVDAVDVLRADPPGVFDREAVLAVRRWRYAPAAGASDARVVLQFTRP